MHVSRKSLHSVWEVCICLKKPCIPLGRGEHEVRTSAAFWSLFSESSHLPSVFAVFEEGDGGGPRWRRPIIVSELYQDGMRIHVTLFKIMGEL